MGCSSAQASVSLCARETDITQAFASKGVEVPVGDLLDQRTIAPALKDVTQAYLVYPVDVSIIAAAANWAQAVRTAANGVRTLTRHRGPVHS